MNKKSMSILALAVFAASFVPKSYAGGGDVAAGAAAGGVVGLGVGYLIGKDKGGDPIEKEEAKQMKADRKARERARRRKEAQQREAERRKREAQEAKANGNNY